MLTILEPNEKPYFPRDIPHRSDWSLREIDCGFGLGPDGVCATRFIRACGYVGEIKHHTGKKDGPIDLAAPALLKAVVKISRMYGQSGAGRPDIHFGAAIRHSRSRIYTADFRSFESRPFGRSYFEITGFRIPTSDVPRRRSGIRISRIGDHVPPEGVDHWAGPRGCVGVGCLPSTFIPRKTAICCAATPLPGPPPPIRRPRLLKGHFARRRLAACRYAGISPRRLPGTRILSYGSLAGRLMPNAQRPRVVGHSLVRRHHPQSVGRVECTASIWQRTRLNWMQ